MDGMHGASTDSTLNINEEWLAKKLPPLDNLVAVGGNMNDISILS